MEENTMRKQLKGYIPYENKEYERIWKEALVVIDTNVILNFYRYSSDTRNEVWKILDKIKSRLWIPYQVCIEYSRNKDIVIERVENSLTKIETEISKQFHSSTIKLQEVDKKEISCKEKIIQAINNANEEIKKLIEEERRQQEHFSENDIVLNKMLELFDGQCGEMVEEDKLNKIKEEAKRREDKKIPPGYCDHNKEENFGDYYIFYDIMQKAKKEKRDIIFVTNDEKPDWYLCKDGKNKGGRPELLNEFYKNTKQLLFICNTNTFVKQYNKYFQENRTPDRVIEEIEDVSKIEDINDKYIFKSNNLRNILLKRDVEGELLELIDDMITILRKALHGKVKREDALRTVEITANAILENMKYEKYHGKILILMDELEREEHSRNAIIMAIRKLDYISLKIRQQLS